MKSRCWGVVGLLVVAVMGCGGCVSETEPSPPAARTPVWTTLTIDVTGDRAEQSKANRYWIGKQQIALGDTAALEKVIRGKEVEAKESGRRLIVRILAEPDVRYGEGLEPILRAAAAAGAANLTLACMPDVYHQPPRTDTRKRPPVARPAGIPFVSSWDREAARHIGRSAVRVVVVPSEGKVPPDAYYDVLDLGVLVPSGQFSQRLFALRRDIGLAKRASIVFVATAGAATEFVSHGMTDAQSAGFETILLGSGGLARLVALERHVVAPKVFYGVGYNPQHIVYAIDVSGSMIDTLDVVKAQLMRHSAELLEGHSFQIVTFSDGLRDLMKPERMLDATEERKLEAARFLKPLKAVPERGDTDPLPALKRAFELLTKAKPKWKGKQIFLLTDGQFDQPRSKILAAIRKWNEKKDVAIYTFLYGFASPDPKDANSPEAVLKAIAEENKGAYEYIKTD